MELRHLRYYVAVATEMSFTRAAAKLHLSQPSLTRQIKNLEEELRVQLFSRDQRSIALTDQGQYFPERTKKLLAQSALDVLEVRRRGAGNGTLHIATPPTCTTTCCLLLWVLCAGSGRMWRSTSLT